MKKICHYYFLLLAAVIGVRFLYGVTLQSRAVTQTEELHQLRLRKAELYQRKQELQFAQAKSYSLQAVAASQAVNDFVSIESMHPTYNVSSVAQQ